MSGHEQLIGVILRNLGVGIFVLATLSGIAIGIGLNIDSARTLRFLKLTNRRVRTHKQVSAPTATQRGAQSELQRRRWSGATLLLGGTYIVYMLLFVVDTPHVAVALSKFATPVLVAIAVDSLKWFLLFAGVAAILTGAIMLAPDRFGPMLLARLSRWLPFRKLPGSGDEMYMSLDHLAEAWPRASGLALASLSTFALIAAIVAWTGH